MELRLKMESNLDDPNATFGLEFLVPDEDYQKSRSCMVIGSGGQVMAMVPCQLERRVLWQMNQVPKLVTSEDL